MLDLILARTRAKAYLVSLLGGLLALLGVFYMTFSAEAEGEYTLRAFAVDMADMLELPSIPGVYETAARSALNTSGGMANALPPAREGWTLRDWDLSDGKALVAATDSMETSARRAAADVVVEFQEVARGEIPGVLATYARGAERIVVMIRRLPVAQKTAKATSLAERESIERSLVDTGRAPLSVHGLALTGGMPPEPATARPFEALTASISGQIVVDVAANVGREALVAQLAGLNLAYLNGFADAPDPLVSADKGVVVAPDLLEADVTRGPAPGFDLTGSVTSQTKAAEAGAERPGTGVCVRRAGVRICE